jgi:hypothetical protein
MLAGAFPPEDLDKACSVSALCAEDEAHQFTPGLSEHEMAEDQDA